MQDIFQPSLSSLKRGEKPMPNSMSMGGLYGKKFDLVEKFIFLIWHTLLPYVCKPWLLQGEILHAYLMVKMGPMKTPKLATPLRCKGRLLFMMGAFQRHLMRVSLSTMSKWLMQKICGGSTTYHIHIYLEQGVYCVGTLCGIVTHLLMCKFQFAFM